MIDSRGCKNRSSKDGRGPGRGGKDNASETHYAMVDLTVER